MSSARASTSTIPNSLSATEISGSRSRASAEPRTPNPDKTADQTARTAQSETTRTIETNARLPGLREVKVQLHIDDRTGEVYGRIVDRQSGDEVAELPAEDVRRLAAHIRSQLDHLIDKSA